MTTGGSFSRVTKSALKGILPSKLLADLRNFQRILSAFWQIGTGTGIEDIRHIHRIALSQRWAERNLENLLRTKYLSTMDTMDQRSILRSQEFKVHSQNGEDGLLLYVFSRIGSVTHQAVNIGCGGSSNTANLIFNFGWRSYEIDGDGANVQTSEEYYRSRLGKAENNVVHAVRWLTRENCNETLKNIGVAGDIDLLSLDIDGNDYWVWEALDVIRPRLVVIEYNASFGPARSLTCEYDLNFNRWEKHSSGWYHGASLMALARLGRRKGYALIGCESQGINAIFVRRELLGDVLVETAPCDAYYPHAHRIATMSVEDQYNLIRDMPYVQIDE